MNVTHTNTMTGEAYTTTQTVQLGKVNSYSECQGLASNYVNFLNQVMDIFNP
ncbi:hypothetical protein [Lacinutrix jangbogonensis]|uniref:hypothetical protein n=1 Tax=Lacinutrix jangbogonensis TaxID=1469557 RepID=UPI0012E025C9|nr:hypothetical protein [Lacinutrix jangbogonensis]